ncbi:hypothetical protein [Nocardioides convexus]|uniref:hypothetical protein n=1 Tax=Nocardioides convexus TaxID=2712224 RepID=UPI0024188E1C|nr:hypothetical protein [Nocardioides convexus]
MPPRAAPLSPEDRREALIRATRPLLYEHGRAVTTKADRRGGGGRGGHDLPGLRVQGRAHRRDHRARLRARGRAAPARRDRPGAAAAGPAARDDLDPAAALPRHLRAGCGRSGRSARRSTCTTGRRSSPAWRRYDAACSP